MMLILNAFVISDIFQDQWQCTMQLFSRINGFFQGGRLQNTLKIKASVCKSSNDNITVGDDSSHFSLPTFHDTIIECKIIHYMSQN